MRRDRDWGARNSMVIVMGGLDRYGVMVATARSALVLVAMAGKCGEKGHRWDSFTDLASRYGVVC